jgi:hypothetical protein
MDNSTAFSSLTWCAGAIAHDSIHSKLFHDYQKAHSGSVPESAWTGPAAEQQCIAHQLRVLKEIDAPSEEIHYCASTPDDFYDVRKYGTNYGEFYANHLKGTGPKETR